VSTKPNESSAEADWLPELWPVVPADAEHKTYHDHLVVVYRQEGVTGPNPWRFVVIDRQHQHHWFFGPRSSCPTKQSAFMRGANSAKQLNDGTYVDKPKEDHRVKHP
jgi:hypothetical protein